MLRLKTRQQDRIAHKFRRQGWRDSYQLWIELSGMDGEFETLVCVAIFDKCSFFWFLVIFGLFDNNDNRQANGSKANPLVPRSKYITKLLLHRFGFNVFEKYFPFNCDRSEN